MKSPRRTPRSRAAVLVEYALLLTFVAVPTMAGVTLGGQRMLTSYQRSRAQILSPMP
jgi:hypothetical protein